MSHNGTSQDCHRRSRRVPPAELNPNMRGLRAFFSRYNVKKTLGKGSFGSVSLVQSKKSGKTFAAKVVKNPSRYKGVIEEVRIFANLLGQGNRHIIKFVCEYENECWSRGYSLMLFEYANGGDLSSLADNYYDHEDMVPTGFLWHAFTGLAEAVAFCHYGLSFDNDKIDRNWTQVVHCDIKPENVLLRWNSDERGHEYPDVVLTDFGVAVSNNRLTSRESRSWAGTPHYWGPEGYNGLKGDVWALGATIHALAFDMVLPVGFVDDSTAKLLSDGECVRQPMQIGDGNSCGFDNLLNSALTRNPFERPTSVALHRALRFKGRRERSAHFRPLAKWATRPRPHAA